MVYSTRHRQGQAREGLTFPAPTPPKQLPIRRRWIRREILNSRDRSGYNLQAMNLMPSSHYWADWDPTTSVPNIIRRDTRLYWLPQRQGTVGRCVGAFVGENPGSAESIFGLGFAGYSLPEAHAG